MAEKTREEQLNDFRLWVKSRLLQKRMSQTEFAKELNISQPRISEAINGKGKCKKYIPMILENLGGDVEEYSELLK